VYGITHYNIETKIPNNLRDWFIIHFIVDMIFTIPLIFFPEIILPTIG